ncbi:MAG TPA: trans-4-hydroxy-L-proline dehydratase [Symbiobacteriaceae bacterium]|nr:trans-4-hydroxy-L-proline dehydratase [Symbiobacteriaceae bacterium]
MNERVAKLRQESLDATPSLSTERAELMTRFHKEFTGPMSVPVRRALAFKYVMEHKTICINDGELIVGERGPAPKAGPTYPELSCHSLRDLEMVNSREKIPFAVSDEAMRVYREEIIPFWQGKSMRDLIFQEMTQEWRDAYDAGIFTEFMEQRAPGHTCGDDKVFRKGFLDFKQEIETSLENLDYFADPEAYAKSEQLKAMSIACDAVIRFAERHAEKALELAAACADPVRRRELEEIAAVCRHVPAHAPRNFREALQAYWFTHLGVITELNTWDAFNPGRLDQHLYPLYKKGVEDGTLTVEQARELLQCFWVKFNNQPAPPKVGVTAEESGTYTDFANINSGGLKPDGSDGVNDVTYLVLEVIDEMRLLQPSSNIQLSKKSPDRFLKAAARIIRKGWGQPSIFNADAIVEELIRQGKSIEDARMGGASGCVEAGAFGKEAYILTGYFNIPKILELTLNNGVDPRTGKQLGPQTGDVRDFASYDELFTAFKVQMKYFIDIKIKGSNTIERMYAMHMPAPFLSVVIDDCIKKGKDYHDGGPRYNTCYLQGVGIGSITDSLSAIKCHVFDQKTLSLEELLAALRSDFEGHERTRQLLVNKTPKYGNDDDYADSIMVSVFNAYYDQVNGRPNTRGGSYRVNMLPTTCHVYFGAVTGALPDGRRAWVPVSEGISPAQGADRHGPTAVIKSAAKMDHLRTGGTLLNQKFTPQVLEGEEGIEKLANLVRSYFKLDGHHIQFNVVRAETLRAAQREPEKYRDLIVRVAGYSDYFCDLSKALQDEVILRTEHSSF